MDIEESCMLLIQKLYKDGSINDDQRDALKDMVLDEDSILLSFFNRYTEPEDEDDLKKEVIKYVSQGNVGGKALEEQNTTGDSVDALSSPMDQMVGMKKKMRLAALQKNKAEAAKPKTSILGVADCDIGLSPQLSKGSILSKGGKMSPL